ncbi:DUF2161 domain-containing phosphodiesterase [Wenxinia marina]|uniref:Uncharacterized protein n=1 Tax=Wenxinia marina DSM 24838 TaxID=1123501 RepID=A0A0D0QBS2_9RHOB|nr:DUF2161 family putative PD-(D/E)XK-type phosphodiesterase [Wenxinia marina]KIQ69712.1 hypothetical protein Wenmar_02076 [Wenxinia marina DSM 24838]GGL60623.1 hypothetical protein GCM10011392_13830 [Wenxinia marina]
MIREADLAAPVKAHLERQGYVVKAEVGACDLMAVRGDEPPVIVELKTSFSLQLVLQGVARLALFDHVYLAVAVPPKRGWGPRYRDIVALCRRLGLGLLAVKGDAVEAHLDPGPYAPRKSAARAGRLIREFDRRVGDPNIAGTTGIKRVTAYRQDALRCAGHLSTGEASPAAIARATGVARAGAILRDDHYGWFERVAHGIYRLTPNGRAALDEWSCELARLAEAAE